MTANSQSLPGRSHAVVNKPIMSIRLVSGCYSAVRINVQRGKHHADIRLDRADIRHPEPFDIHGLTPACRAYIQDAVKHAVAKDGRKRSVTWPSQPTHTHGDQHD